jgi:hypothetical protein
MKRLILIKLMQNPKAMKTIVKYLNGALRQVPVKQIIEMIGPAIYKIRALLEQVIHSVIEFAVKNAGRLPAFK